jgi:hypothetical protein
MVFSQFCKRLATNEAITDTMNVTDVNDDVKGRAHALCQIMKPKMDILDRIEIGFIEEAFRDMDRAEKVLAEYNDGYVPDYLLKTLSETLYGHEFTSLNADQQSIIKILSAYICISIQDSNKNY